MAGVVAVIIGVLLVAALCWTCAWFGTRLALEEWRDPVVGPGRSFAVMAMLINIMVAALPVPFIAALLWRFCR